MIANPSIAAAKQTDLLALVQNATRLRKVSAHEWAGACPKCGGRDRFRVDPSRGWFCRQCTGTPGDSGHWQDAIDYVMWLDGLDFKRAIMRLGGKLDITPAEIERRAAARKAADDKRRLDEAEQRARVVQTLNESGVAEEYHRNLEIYPEGYDFWFERGLSVDWINYYRLGYCKSRQYSSGDETVSSASITIPCWRTEFINGAYNWRVINLRHRLLAQDSPGGKYRPHLPGAGNHLFYTDPMTRRLFGDVLIVEGEIKAMVTWAAFWEGENLLAPRLFVIGLPGKSWKPEYLSEIEMAKRVFILLDPDATSDAKRLAAAVGKDRAHVVDLPDKVDDLINAGMLDGKTLLQIMNW